MKKRIFAILILALTLSLFAFPAFAASYIRDDIVDNQVYTLSGTSDFGASNSQVVASSVTLYEGLYLIDFDFDYYDGEINDASFYLKDIVNTNFTRTIYTFTFWSDIKGSFYVYISTPFNIVFGSTSGTTWFDYTITIYSTKHYNDFVQEGYNNGLNNGFETGYEVGYGDAQAEAGDAYKDGYDNGYDAGKTIGYNHGNEEGFKKGYTLGEADGWENAIKDADEVKTAIGGIFTGVFDGIVDSFNELTEGVTIMGLTLKQILLTIFAIGIIGICIWLFGLKK